MVIKVYVTNICSSMRLKKEMLHVTDILSSMNIPMETIDISDPSKEEDKKFMRANAEPKEGMKNPLPPQIFSDDEYCGGYDRFYDAVESNGIYVFLKMADKIEVSQAQIEVEQDGAEEEKTSQVQEEHNQVDKGEEEEEGNDQVAEEEEKKEKEQTDVQTECQD